MGFNLYVHLEDEIAFDSKAEQDRLAEEIDSKTFIGPEFVGASDNNRVVVKARAASLDTDDANQIGDIVAAHFDTTAKRVRLDSA